MISGPYFPLPMGPIRPLRGQKRVKEGQHCQEVDLLGPQSFHLQGPKAPPGPVEFQAQELVFLEEYKPPVIPGGASHVGTAKGQTSPEVKGPLQFSGASAARAFSGPQARISNAEGATPQLCPPPPSENWPRRARRFQPYHAVCSQHSSGGSWSIANFCQECEYIALAV